MDLSENMGLIYAAVKSCDQYVRTDHPTRSWDDYVQLAAIAFLEAVEQYRPADHGAFATYYFGRYRFMAGRYSIETDRAVRVPYIAYRRGTADLPTVLDLANYQEAIDDQGDVDPRQGDALERTIKAVANDVIAASNKNRRDRNAQIVGDLLRGRWLIPNRDAWDRVADIADRHGVTVKIITSLEGRFQARLARRLRIAA